MTYFHCQSAERQNTDKGREEQAIKRASKENAGDRKEIGSAVIVQTDTSRSFVVALDPCWSASTSRGIQQGMTSSLELLIEIAQCAEVIICLKEPK